MSQTPKITRVIIVYDDGTTAQIATEGNPGTTRMPNIAKLTIIYDDEKTTQMDIPQAPIEEAEARSKEALAISRSTQLTSEEYRRYRIENRCFRCGQKQPTNFPMRTKKLSQEEVRRYHIENRCVRCGQHILAEEEEDEARIDSHSNFPNQENPELKLQNQSIFTERSHAGGEDTLQEPDLDYYYRMTEEDTAEPENVSQLN